MKAPLLIKENQKMAEGLKSLVGKKMSKEVKFMGTTVTINKLNVSEVLSIQEKAKGIAENDAESFALLRTVISTAVPEAAELSEEDFNNFPLDELSNLSAEIMKYSGLGEKGK